MDGQYGIALRDCHRNVPGQEAQPVHSVQLARSLSQSWAAQAEMSSHSSEPSSTVQCIIHVQCSTTVKGMACVCEGIYMSTMQANHCPQDFQPTRRLPVRSAVTAHVSSTPQHSSEHARARALFAGMAYARIDRLGRRECSADESDEDGGGGEAHCVCTGKDGRALRRFMHARLRCLATTGSSYPIACPCGASDRA